MFSSPRKPRKSRAKPQQSAAPEADILSEAPAPDTETMPEIADIFDSDSTEPTEEELANLTEEEMLLGDDDRKKQGVPGIFDDTEGI